MQRNDSLPFFVLTSKVAINFSWRNVLTPRLTVPVTAPRNNFKTRQDGQLGRISLSFDLS